MKQLTREQAIEIAESGVWKDWSDEEVVKLQLYQDKLCMDFGRFHEATEKVLGRGVWTHEFAWPKFLREEYEGFRPKPTIEEIFNMLPKGKSFVLVTKPQEENKDEA